MDDDIIGDASVAVRSGDLIGVPTDTLYGIAADPFNEDALERIFEVKGRPGLKPLAILVADLEQAQTLAAFSDRALELAERHWPGALTLVLPKLATTPEWLGDRARRTIGLRCPDHPETREFLHAAGPLAVTSANVAGQSAVADDEAAKELFGPDIAVYIPGESLGDAASTILDLTQPAEWVLRDALAADPASAAAEATLGELLVAQKRYREGEALLR
jgi:tRNA threonylcarbamoyl adenosine modification protein (Sua5/YciO/YrdC/YwlC family)